MFKNTVICLIFSFCYVFSSPNSYAKNTLRDGFMENLEIVESQIEKCHSLENYTPEYMLKALKLLYPKSKEKIKVNNITINNPHLGIVKLYKRLTHYENSSNQLVLTEGIFKDNQQKDCKDILCLSDKIFGEGLGVYYLYFLDQFNFNLSHLSNPNPSYTHTKKKFKLVKKFTEDELKVILKALSILPKVSFQNVKLGFHMKRSDYKNGSVVANDSMTIFNLFSEISSPEKIRVILHEIGHLFAVLAFNDRLGDNSNREAIDTSSIWHSFSNWNVIEKDGQQAPRSSVSGLDKTKENFVSRYSKSQPAEDFAESFASYILNPVFLKKIAPLKYQFIKNKVFNHYTFEEKACSSSPNLLFSDEQLNNIYTGKIDKITKNCFSAFTKSVKTLKKNELYRCISKEIRETPIYPTVFGLDEIKIELSAGSYLDDIYLSLTEKLVEQIKSPKSCEKNQGSFFNRYMKINGKKKLRRDFLALAPLLCQATKSDLSAQNKDFNKKNIKKSAKKIILERVRKI